MMPARAVVAITKSLITCGLLFGVAPAAPPQPDGMAPQATLAHPAVLVCPNLVDLVWSIPDSDLTVVDNGEVCTADFSFYTLSRGPDPYSFDTQVMIAQLAAMQSTYRDMTVQEGAVYWYDTTLRYLCPADRWVFAVRKLGDSPVTIGPSCLGQVRMDLTLSVDELVSPSMTVAEGITLIIDDTTIRGGAIRSAAATSTISLDTPPGGMIRIRGSTLERTKVAFAGLGQNELVYSTIHGEQYTNYVTVQAGAEVDLSHNDFYTGSVRIENSNLVSVEGNTFYYGYLHSSQSIPTPYSARMLVRGNRFYASSQGTAVYQYGGGVIYRNNVFEGAGHPLSDRAIHLDPSSSSVGTPHPAEAHIEGNQVTGYRDAVVLNEPNAVTVAGNVLSATLENARITGGTATFEDNVIRGGGYYGLNLQGDAQVTAEGNALTRNSHGVRVTDAAVAVLRYNCIAGNADGVYVSNLAGPDAAADARENWWGDVSGPLHDTNPTGLGDTASSRVLIADWLVIDTCFTDVAATVIGAAGGTVTSTMGTVSISLPPGAVSAETFVALRVIDPASLPATPQPPQGLSALRGLDVSARSVADGTPVTSLAQPATLTVSLTREELAQLAPASVALYRLVPDALALAERSPGLEAASLAGTQDETAAWGLVPGVLDEGEGVLTALSGDLGLFAVFGESTRVLVYLPVVLR